MRGGQRLRGLLLGLFQVTPLCVPGVVPRAPPRGRGSTPSASGRAAVGEATSLRASTGATVLRPAGGDD